MLTEVCIAFSCEDNKMNGDVFQVCFGVIFGEYVGIRGLSAALAVGDDHDFFIRIDVPCPFEADDVFCGSGECKFVTDGRA